MGWYLEQLYDSQFELMLQRWRSENPEQEPDAETVKRLRIQTRMIVDDVDNAQRAEVTENLYAEDE
ncbi:MAG: hypothetical protein WBN99_05330 [Mycobacterium sp.]